MTRIEIKPDPLHPKTHKLVTIEHRGRVYGCRWAQPWPTEERVREQWELDRKQRARRNRTFLPYDQSTGHFIVDWRF